MSPSHSLHARQTWGRAADAFETVAWRAPAAARFDSHVASDAAADEPTFKDVMAAMPDWIVILGGGAVAALMGAMLGGALAV